MECFLEFSFQFSCYVLYGGVLYLLDSSSHHMVQQLSCKIKHFDNLRLCKYCVSDSQTSNCRHHTLLPHICIHCLNSLTQMLGYCPVSLCSFCSMSGGNVLQLPQHLRETIPRILSSCFPMAMSLTVLSAWRSTHCTHGFSRL